MAFNSNEYSYVNLKVQIGTRVVEGLRGVSYEDDQEMEYLYGRGNEPQGIQEGNIKYGGELKLLQSELERLIQDAPGHRIQNLPEAIITVEYSRSGVVVTDQLLGVRFPKMPKMMDQNAKFMEVTLPIMFTKLRLGV